MERRRSLLYMAVPLLLLVTLACGPCGLFSADVPTPPHPVVVSAASAEQLESRIQQNLGGEPGKQFIMHMTDEEITSLVATKLAQNDESPVVDPQIWFTKGKVYGSGRLTNVLPIEATLYLVASAQIQDGQVVIALEETSAGALPIPDGVLETISRSINETMNDLQLQVQVTALEILEGEAIVKGIRQ
jgi:uncharacterized protein YpmS